MFFYKDNQFSILIIHEL